MTGSRGGCRAWLFAGLMGVCAVFANTVAAAEKSDRLVLSGGGAGGSNAYGYAGLVVPLSGDLNGQGVIVRLWANVYTFGYRTTLNTVGDTPVNAVGYGATAEAGYQWAVPGTGRIAAFGGISFRDHALSPDDPGSSLDEGEAGLALTLDGSLDIAGNIAIAANARYTAGFDEYWLQARPHYRFANAITAGPEFVVLGGDDYGYLRVGAFVGDIPLKLPSLGRIFVSLEAGYQRDRRENRGDFYAGLHTSLSY